MPWPAPPRPSQGPEVQSRAPGPGCLPLLSLLCLPGAGARCSVRRRRSKCRPCRSGRRRGIGGPKVRKSPLFCLSLPVPSGGAATPGFATSLHHASQPLTAHQAVSVSRVAAGDVGTAGGAAQGLQPAPGSGSTRFFAFVCFTQARKHVAFIHLLTEVASPSAVLALVVSSPSRYSIFPFLPLSLKLSLSLSFSFSSGSGSGRGVHRTGGC